MEKKEYFLPVFIIKQEFDNIIVMSGTAIDDGKDNELGGSELDLGGLG